MRNRLLIFGCAATASLALTGHAFAKTPRLIVTGTTIQVQEEKTDAAPAMIQMYGPTGYTVALSPAAGTKIGTAHADIQALAISTDAIIPADGELFADAPANYLTNSCAPGMHTAVWIIRITVSGVAFNVPIYIDAPPPGAEAGLGAFKLTACFSDPYVKASPTDPQPKVLNAILRPDPTVVVAPTSGTFLWRSVITPWSTTTPAPDAAHTVEAQSIVSVPASLSLNAKLRTIRHKRHGRTTVTNSVLLSGRLLENLNGVAGVKVALSANGKSAGSATTGSTGTFSKTVGLRKKTTFKATATVPTRETPCVSPLATVPGGCVSATLAGYKLSSNRMTVSPKKR
jgi:hypothetical protein